MHDLNDIIDRAARHCESSTINRRTKPLTPVEVAAIVEDDMKAFAMHATIEQLAEAPPVYAVRIFEPGKCRENFDPYFAACVAAVQDDGVPEVMLFNPPPMTREQCREVRQALGEAFVAKGWTHYYRVHPGNGKRIKKPCLPIEETCEA